MSPFTPLRAYTPWPTTRGSPEDLRGDAHPTQRVAYVCDRDCLHSPLSLPYAVEATPPAAVDCRCGGTARRDGAPADARPSYPKYATGGKNERDKNDVTPEAQLAKRGRTKAEKEALLAERMAEVRQSGVAR